MCYGETPFPRSRSEVGCAWCLQVRETRALMCCFAAVDPREACLQQLRHTEDWSPVDQDTDRATCRATWVGGPCMLYACLS